MIRRMLVVVVLCGAAFVLAAVPALASLGGEVAAGRQVAQRVDTGAVTCSGLEDTDFEHLGEYVMGRMLGSSSTHAAMNARMAVMIGDTSAEGMHELMGRRYAGCPTGGRGRDDGLGDDERRRGVGRVGRDAFAGLRLDARRRLAAHEPDGLAGRGRPLDGSRG